MNKIVQRSLPVIGATLNAAVFSIHLWLTEPLARSRFDFFPSPNLFTAIFTYGVLDLLVVMLFAGVGTLILKQLGVRLPGLVATGTLVVCAVAFWFLQKFMPVGFSQTEINVIFLLFDIITGAIILPLAAHWLQSIKNPSAIRRLWAVAAVLAIAPMVFEFVFWLQLISHH